MVLVTDCSIHVEILGVALCFKVPARMHMRSEEARSRPADPYECRPS